MASREVAEADSRILAGLLADGTPLARKGQSESPANLLRASEHVVMESLTAVQESLALLFTKTGQVPPHGLEDTLDWCKQVIEPVGLISYKQERRDAGSLT